MNDNDWLHRLDSELARRAVPPGMVRQVVAEAAAHLRDSGQDPVVAFGRPDGYATAVADSLAESHIPPRRPGQAQRSQPPGTLGEVRLAAKRISKRHGRRRVLHRVGLTVHAGEIAAIIGANGTGKSTFLRICAGLLSADAGQVVVNGTVGYCPQQGGTCDFLLPDEHFVLIGAGRGLNRERSRSQGRAAATQLGWDAAEATTARHLSGGTRQKLNLLMAGLGEPDILLLDEPYQGFDRATYQDFWQQVAGWRDAGKAVLVVTHLLDDLDRVDTVLDLSAARRGVAA